MKFILTTHAYRRLLERLTIPDDTTFPQAVKIIMGMWGAGVPFGAQVGKDSQLRLCTHDRSGERCVLATEMPDKDTVVIKTVMTEGEANNAQTRYIHHQPKTRKKNRVAQDREHRGHQLARRKLYERRHWDDEDDD